MREGGDFGGWDVKRGSRWWWWQVGGGVIGIGAPQNCFHTYFPPTPEHQTHALQVDGCATNVSWSTPDHWMRWPD